MWYLVVNNKQIGPIQETDVDTYIRQGRITPQTLVWQQGMSAWTPLHQTNLNALVVAQPRPIKRQTLASPVLNIAMNPGEQAAGEIRNLFTWMWICLIGGTLLTWAYVGLIGLIAGLVLYYVLLHQYWSVIQDGYARTTPGKAVGYLFIPFYNWFWMFEAFHGLAKDTNAYIDRHAVPAKKVSEGVALWICICTLISIIPYVNFVSGIASFILLIINYNELKNAAIAIIRHRSLTR